jgi:hypothetical protein
MRNPVVFRYARHLIAFIVAFGSFGFLFALVYRSVPDGNKDIINVAAGFVLGVLGTVASYYFGNSKDKSDADQAARTEGTTTTTSTTKTTP